MSSTYSPWYKRKILYHIPGLFKKCPEGNYHWFWHRWCYCIDNSRIKYDLWKNKIVPRGI